MSLYGLKCLKVLGVARLIPIYLLLLMPYPGCSAKIEPRYALIEPGARSSAMEGKGIPTGNGWEFQFPGMYNVQKVIISYEGGLARLALHSKTDRGWKHIKSADVQASSPLEIILTPRN